MYGSSCVLLNNGNVLVAGVCCVSTDFYKYAVYNVQSNSWIYSGSAPKSLQNTIAFYLGERVFVSSGMTVDTFEFLPDTNTMIAASNLLTLRNVIPGFVVVPEYYLAPLNVGCKGVR